MRCWIVFVFASSAWIFQLAKGSYETGPGYGVSHSSYGVAPAAHTPAGGWGSGHAGGSYYHYHVPLVGQQSHYQAPVQHHQGHDHHLHYILPLILLAALPLLLLPLLPLLLLPLGLSLLALLLPLLMMGGMMMMMMMMMMDGGMMMMMRNGGHRNPSYSNGDARSGTFGSLVLEDLTQLVGRYARSLDLDRCPERIACEAGSFIFPSGNATEVETARSWMDFLVEQAVPKGKTRKLLHHYKRAFWVGSKTRTCAEFQCQPVFRLVADEPVPGNPDAASRNNNYAEYYKLANTGVNGTNRGGYHGHDINAARYYYNNFGYQSSPSNATNGAAVVRRVVVKPSKTAI